MNISPRVLRKESCALAHSKAKRRSWLAQAVAGGFLVVGIYASADDSFTITVTGTRLKRVEVEGALPVQVITRDQLDRASAQTAYEVLDRVSAAIAYGGYNDALSTQNSNMSGFAGVSLRGLGFDKVLVLINGRRVVNYPLSRSSTGVDLNSIPVEALDCVEILLDGASAVYGSDAIAGTVNFITRKDFEGAQLSAYYALPQQPGGRQRRATMTAGWGDAAKDTFNISFFLNHLDNKGIAATSRDFSKTGYLPGLGIDRTSSISFPASVLVTGSLARTPVDPTPNAGSSVLSPLCIPPGSFPTLNSPHRCGYDSASRNDILNPSSGTSAFGQWRWRIGPKIELFGDAFYSRKDATFVTQETTADRLTLPASSAFYPSAWLQANYPTLLGSDLRVSLRTVELGRRAQETRSEYERVTVGTRGTTGHWDFDAAFNYDRSSVHNSFTEGWLDARLFYPLFQSGIINPFGFNLPDVVARMNATRVDQEMQRAIGEQKSLNLKASGEVAKLNAGALTAALGGDLVKEGIEQWRAPILENGNLVGGIGAIPTMAPKDRNIASIFFEFGLPVTSVLEVQAAVRYDRYSDFGNTTNPKLSFRWKPSRLVMVRGSAGTGFRAPSLVELYQPTYSTLTNGQYSDPLRCPQTGSSLDCNRQLPVVRGGNPNLKPETSHQWSLGIVLDPMPRLSMSLDAFRIDVRDVLAQRSEGYLAGLMFDANSAYARRAVPSPSQQTLPGPVQTLLGASENLGRKQVTGADTEIIARFLVADLGRIAVRLNGTLLAVYKQQRDSGSFPNIVGTREDLGSVPRWKHTLAFDWDRGAWNATLKNYYAHSYAEPCVLPLGSNRGDSSGCKMRTVSAYETWDVSTGYNGFANTSLRFGLKNIFNRSPPLSNQIAAVQIGYDPTYADPRGRAYYLSAQHSLKW